MALKCFIAMAFGHKDTDGLYDKAINPLLRRKGITPFRVDRSNRNEDIDDQILSELGECDFVIADLTYARPSVYFEAGVAQGRPVKVIYTCRRDHFKHRDDDQHGNFRVHFDLQMKPIIPWVDSKDSAFAHRLNRRVEHIIGPLVRQRKMAATAQEKGAAFAPLPLREKLNRLSRVYQSTIKRRGYKFTNKHDGAWVIPVRSKHLKWSQAGFFDSPSKNDLSMTTWRIHRSSLRTILNDLFKRRNLPRRVSVDVICCALQNVRASRIAAALPDYRIYTSGSIITAEHEFEIEAEKYPKSRRDWVSNLDRKVARLPVYVTATFISGIKHDEQLRSALNEVLV